jgi:hypothetical protein
MPLGRLAVIEFMMEATDDGVWLLSRQSGAAAVLEQLGSI